MSDQKTRKKLVLCGLLVLFVLVLVALFFACQPAPTPVPTPVAPTTTRTAVPPSITLVPPTVTRTVAPATVTKAPTNTSAPPTITPTAVPSAVLWAPVATPKDLIYVVEKKWIIAVSNGDSSVVILDAVDMHQVAVIKLGSPKSSLWGVVQVADRIYVGDSVQKVLYYFDTNDPAIVAGAQPKVGTINLPGGPARMNTVGSKVLVPLYGEAKLAVIEGSGVVATYDVGPGPFDVAALSSMSYTSNTVGRSYTVLDDGQSPRTVALAQYIPWSVAVVGKNVWFMVSDGSKSDLPKTGLLGTNGTFFKICDGGEGGKMLADPLHANGILIACGGDAKVAGYDTQTGAEYYTKVTGGAPFGLTFCQGGDLCVGIKARKDAPKDELGNVILKIPAPR